MEDRRQYHRLEVKLPATFRVPSSGSYAAQATTLNISATGIGMTAKDSLDVGREVVVKLSLPDGEPIEIHTQVVWSKEVLEPEHHYRIGLSIIDQLRPGEKKFVKLYASKFIDHFKKPDSK